MSSDSADSRRRSGRWLLLVGAGCLLSLVIGLHLGLLPRLPTPRLLTFGGIAEWLIALLLASILVALQSRDLPARIHALLSVGLILWLVSCVSDVLDELVRQPLWVSAFAEDVPRVLGMLLAALGLLGLVRHSGQMMQELERLSLREPLTGLGNRRRFNQVVNQRQDRGFGLLLMDLDHFKRVNDRFGHAVGDEVLSQVADVLRGLAPEPDDLFRLGGEEFAMIVAPDDDEGLETLSRRIVRAVAALRPRDDLGVTLSIGVGRSRPAEPPLELMQRVDRALYQAKADGRNQVAVARD
ncbi:GGDEF domain-containing protein [Wenzhouxiangella sp. XN79A]|uniref:diguanylate cyclase domain-containing protein n=1 Tax=Wenzhouxiangella sp. XN79A TaxID=2724193 RepID=UPI00144A5B3F|nr:GGDEF domain-containing protein [Wenzhouxiangella sp. XN79A]